MRYLTPEIMARAVALGYYPSLAGRNAREDIERMLEPDTFHGPRSGPGEVEEKKPYRACDHGEAVRRPRKSRPHTTYCLTCAAIRRKKRTLIEAADSGKEEDA